MKLKCLIGVYLTVMVANSDAMINSPPSQFPTHPYYAFIRPANPSTRREGIGGGVLISVQHVLTTGTNIEGFVIWSVGLGSTTRLALTHFQTNRATIHPNFRIQNNLPIFDIGILSLPDRINPSPTIAPMLMAPSSFLSSPNIQGMVLGFADSNNTPVETLRVAHLRILPENVCRTAFPASNNQDIFCGSDTIRGSDFCSGDQGTPFIVMSRDVEYLVGIGSQPGCNATASTFIPVSSIREWIRSEINV